MSQPLRFFGQELHPEDAVRIAAKADLEELGWVEIVLREQFPVDLEGEFDMWFKLVESKVTTVSPEKERPSSASQYQDKQRRFGRLKIRVTLKQRNSDIGEDDEEVPEGLPDCPRCTFLEKLIVSMELEVEGRAELGRLFMIEGQSDDRQDHNHTEETMVETPDYTPKFGSAEAVEIEHLKMVILALNEKMVALQTEKVEVESLRKQLNDSFQARETLQKSSQEAFQQLLGQVNSLSTALRKAESDLATAESGLQTAQSQTTESRLKTDQLRVQVLTLSSQLENYQGRTQNISSLISQNEDLLKRINTGEAQIEGLKTDLEQTTAEFQNRVEEWNSELGNRGRELGKVRVENEELKHALNALKQEIELLKQENLLWKSKAGKLEAETSLLSAKVKKLTIDNQHSSEPSRLGLHTEFAKLTDSYQRKTDEFKSVIAEMTEEHEHLKSLYEDRDASLRREKNTNEQIARENQALKSTLAEQRQSLGVLIDVQQVADSYESRLSKSREAQARLLSDLNFLADSLMSASERSLEVSRLVPRLKALLEEKDTEVEVLRGMVNDFQRTRSIYVPAKDDPVDAALASYVNSQTHLPVTFSRQDEGLYLFGTKRVFLKLENGNIVSTLYAVRVGGGYMRVEEFIEIYTPLELGKLESTREKQRTLRSELLSRLANSSHSEKHQGRVEMSPQRASKILKEFLEGGGEKFSTCFGVQRKKISPQKTQKAKYSLDPKS